ncbi:thioesterase II family protein [Nocardiopsis ansamitocini]|uniref:Thioesterase n=1 Tax=Nocardiopsis ansamitocini TaxID=1670832 RepID=A0A9W6P9N7_9ACTN|nr:alpha/beta fold hydrolase [Nocardiopsis ansamitocini]GLU50200.1 thioesterase [Nocardiopsis ansamitocini]
MTANPTDSWLRRYRPRPHARLRLLCLPHAGGGAGSYRGWTPLLPAGIDLVCVQYPGREDRLDEPPVDDMATLVAGIADAVTPLIDRPYALFGHSMGTAVAFELGRELRRRGFVEPVRLFASGRRAPAARLGGRVHEGDDESLVDELTRLGGTERAIFDDPGMREMILGYVRADYRLIERYVPAEGPPLGCPVSVFLGDADPEVGVEQARGWARTTTGRLDVEVFPGDHFYLVPGRRQVVNTLVRRLDPALAHDSPPWPSTP